MCGPRFSPGRGFGRKSRRGSRDLAGAFPASTVCTRGASRAVLSAAGPRTGPRRQPLGIEGSCATRAFTAPIFRFSPRGASRGYEPWPLEPMAAAGTSRTSKPQNDGISIIRAGRGKALALGWCCRGGWSWQAERPRWREAGRRASSYHIANSRQIRRDCRTTCLSNHCQQGACALESKLHIRAPRT